jgi:cleavage and polyadenylation specificity factor subunit 5
MQRLRTEYQNTGMRRSCEGILVCHEHNHPNVLMLQIANAFFKLPGDYLQAEDDELEGFKRRLDEKLAPMNRLGEGDWDVGPCLAQWFRPGFESFAYPYSLPHISRPTEKKKIYLINLPPSSESRLHAVPDARRVVR